jgi:cell division protein FtsN
LPVPKKDTVYLIVHEVTMELVTISEDSYAIQLGAFREKSNAEALRRRLEKLVGRKIEIVIEDDFYKLRIIEIKERREVDEMLTLFHKEGFTELWVISMKAKRQQLVMVEKQDTTVTVIDLRAFES